MAFAAGRIPSTTGGRASVVRRLRSSRIRLLRSGDRCWTMTKASRLGASTSPKNCSIASSPPAEAPIATIASGADCGSGQLVGAASSGSSLVAEPSVDCRSASIVDTPTPGFVTPLLQS